MSGSQVKVAIAHDYLTQRGGAERVVLAMMRAFPEAKIYTTLYDPEGTYPEFAQAEIVTGPLNRVGLLRRHHRLAFPVLAPTTGRIHIDADVVLASSSGWAHGMNTRGKVLVYCHSPAKWLYRPEEYLGGSAWSSPQGWALLALDRYLRRWDGRAAGRAAKYLANSTVIAEGIAQAYGIAAPVVNPPAGVSVSGEREQVAEVADWDDAAGFFVVVSRLLPYKNVDKAVAAFRGLRERLLIIGDGPLRDSLLADMPGNVRLVSGASDAQMRWAYDRARALVAPSYEDYGLTPVEAATYGKPTVCLGAGGYVDTVVPGVSGLYFAQSQPEDIAAAVGECAQRVWDDTVIRAHTEQFSEANFIARLRAEVQDLA